MFKSKEYACTICWRKDESILIQRNAMFEFVTDIDRVKSCVLWTVKAREACYEAQQIL